MNFLNRVIVITGASSGIGRQLAMDFAARGAIVVGCGRSIVKLKDALKEVRRTSPRSNMIGCDVSDAEQVRGMMKKILADYGQIDILVNNAGIGMRKAFIETSLETVEQLMRTNYLGAVYCTHEALPSMIARRIGHIVNISSVAGKIGTLNLAAYSGSKFALNGWSESLYHELKPLGIKVSVICPGPVQTDFNRDFRNSEPKAPPGMIVSAEAVSREVIQAIDKDKFEVVMPRSLALVSLFARLMPSLFRALAQRQFRKYVKVPESTVDRLTMTGTGCVD
ncbi:MAG TPA: SDR family oxidoreductase [Candidatus Binatia bacterium]